MGYYEPADFLRKQHLLNADLQQKSDLYFAFRQSQQAFNGFHKGFSDPVDPINRETFAIGKICERLISEFGKNDRQNCINEFFERL